MHAKVLWLLVRFLWTVNVLGSALVLWRLYIIKIVGAYRFFFLSIALKAVRSIVLFLPPGPRSHAYYQIWVLTEPLLWLSYILVVYELYSLVLKQYQGIYSVGRWFFFGAVAMSSIVAALTVMTTMTRSSTLPGDEPLLFSYAVIERANNTSLAIFLLLLLALVAWFPVPLNRNLLTHCAVYSAYFFVNNVIMLYWHAVGKEAVMIVNDLRLSVWILCVACWVFLLSLKGEERITSLHLGRSPIEERRLLGQLENLNATLLRTARK